MRESWAERTTFFSPLATLLDIALFGLSSPSFTSFFVDAHQIQCPVRAARSDCRSLSAFSVHSTSLPIPSARAEPAFEGFFGQEVSDDLFPPLFRRARIVPLSILAAVAPSNSHHNRFLIAIRVSRSSQNGHLLRSETGQAFFRVGGLRSTLP